MAEGRSKLPAIQFYPGDWLRDNVAGCSLAAQGLWLRMVFLGHDSERYGYLSINGSAMPPDFVARKCGSSPAEYESLLAELDAAGVPSRTPEGIIFSRRMVRDAAQRAKGAERQKRHRNGGCNGDVTPMSHGSSSSSSTSSSASANTPHKPPKGGGRSQTSYTATFEAFWRAYPRHEGKGAAWKAWAPAVAHVESSKQMTRFDAEEWIVNVAECFAATPKGTGGFCPHAATWLNQRRFDDDQREWNRSGTRSGTGPDARLNGPGVNFGSGAESTGGVRTDF